MIDIRDVSYRYEGGARLALDHVSLTVNKGEILAIVGHNGSGKSTLAKMFNALLLPASGTVTVEGMDTQNDENTLAIRQKIGIVFQNPDNQLVTTIVGEDVGFGPENLGIAPAEIRARVENALTAVDMLPYAERASHMLSGGQKQRVAIAGMLAMQPEVLVLDEATAMLDPRGRREVIAITERLNREKGMTVVMITQHMEETVGCNRIAVMQRGKLRMVDTPKRVFAERALLRECGLEAPAMVRLRDDLIAGGLPIENEPLTIEALTDELCRLKSKI